MARQLYQQIGEPEKASALASGSPQAPKTPGDWLNHAALRDPSDREGQIADYTAALKLDPNFVRALSARGNVYYREGDYDRALKDIDSAIAEEPKDANLYLQKANILRAQGRRDDAIDVASTLSEQLPDNSFAQVAAGQIYNEFGLRKDAIAATDRALRIKPEAYIYVNRARILGDDDVAGQLTELDKALVLDPKEPNALQMRADILSKQGDYDAVVATYDKLIELVPQNEGFWIGQRGIAHWQAGDRKDAESDFATARAKLFEPALLNNLCYNKVKAKVALESALQDCDRALELNPGSAPALDSRAVVYLLMGRNQQALEDFDRALAKSPRLAPSLYGRAVVKARMGDLTGARMDLAQAEEIEPDIVKDLTKRGIDLPESLKGRRN
jgi:tetratricopeptide (TPR) repeat protein